MKHFYLIVWLVLLAGCNYLAPSQNADPTFTQSPTKTSVPSATLNNSLLPSKMPISTPKHTSTTVSGVTSGNPSKDWTGRYYPNTSFTEPFVFERVDDEILFDWGELNPAPNMPDDNFSISWIKCHNFKSKMYTFTADTNANTRLVVILNNIYILESGFGESGEVSVDFPGPGGNHCITLELTHETGPAYVYFSYK